MLNLFNYTKTKFSNVYILKNRVRMQVQAMLPMMHNVSDNPREKTESEFPVNLNI